ncbi:unnamed protein product [Owenia fusiformis]|uniref:Uncharacterized protein n=1 Tax=Owenia fusiformis TaxID=6347 RepID=A0A8J1TTJ9_OWEFU|nr:unnamed protein product [Owenia fusiformis]
MEKRQRIEQAKKAMDSGMNLCQICLLKHFEKTAKFYCLDCSMLLCKYCSNQHKSVKVTQHHELVSRNQADIRGQVCTKHHFAPVKYFCEQCQDLICVNCTMLEHKGHNVKDMSAKAVQCEEKLNDMKGKLDDQIVKLEDSIKMATRFENTVEQNQQGAKLQIAQTVSAAKMELDKQAEDIQTQVEDIAHSRLEAITRDKEILQRKYDKLINKRTVINNRTDRMKDEEYIKEVIKITKNLEKTMNVDIPDTENYKVFKFVAILPKKNKLGHVEETKVDNSDLEAFLTQTEGGNADHKVPAIMVSPKTPIYNSARIVHKFKTSSYMQSPSALLMLPNGKILIVDSTLNGIYTCGKSGGIQQRTCVYEAIKPTGLTLNQNGNLVLSTERHVKIISTDEFTKLNEIPAEKLLRTTGSLPSGVGSDGKNIYISDVHHGRVYHVDLEDKKVLHKFDCMDDTNTPPDAFNLLIRGSNVFLTYSIDRVTNYLKMYNSNGRLLHSNKLPRHCSGLCSDAMGNIIAACGGLSLLTPSGLFVKELEVYDKSAKAYKLYPKAVAFTNDGLLMVINVTQFSKRSEVLILELR